jgi:threonine/homoserine/homoserine lactone efflux protein
MFAAGTVGMDVIAMSAYGLGGAALSRRMTSPRFRRGFSLAVGVLLLTAAALIVLKA